MKGQLKLPSFWHLAGLKGNNTRSQTIPVFRDDTGISLTWRQISMSMRMWRDHWTGWGYHIKIYNIDCQSMINTLCYNRTSIYMYMQQNNPMAGVSNTRKQVRLLLLVPSDNFDEASTHQIYIFNFFYELGLHAGYDDTHIPGSTSLVITH